MAFRDFLRRIGVIRQPTTTTTELSPVTITGAPITGAPTTDIVTPSRPTSRTITSGGRTVRQTISPTGQILEVEVIAEPPPKPPVRERLTQAILRKERKVETELTPIRITGTPITGRPETDIVTPSREIVLSDIELVRKRFRKPFVKDDFTIAIDVGGGKIQDFHVWIEDGVIVRQEPRGDPIPITPRFRESGRIGKSIEELVQEKLVPPETIEIKPSKVKISPISKIPPEALFILPLLPLGLGRKAIEFVSPFFRKPTVKTEELPPERFKPITFEPTPDPEIIFTPSGGVSISKEELKKGIISPTPLPTPTILEPPPTIIEPATPTEKFKGFFTRRGLTDPLTATGILAERVVTAVTIPEEVTKEEPVIFIREPSEPKGTQITRGVGFQDIDTGRLPPQQNFELKAQEILFEFNLGRINIEVAEERLISAEKQFILSESKRTALARAAEGVAIGAISVLAPPVGATIVGAAGISTIKSRKEILAFAKQNPKAAAIQFSAMIIGGVAGAKGVAKLKPPKLGTPSIKLVGKGRQKFINTAVEILEPEFKSLQGKGKITGTRAYEINIPAPKKDVKIRILEYKRDGVARFIGQETRAGKPEGVLGGFTIESGTQGFNKMITRVIRSRNRGRFSNLEISTFLEKANVKASKVKRFRRTTLTESETRLARQFKLKGLNAQQVREILRKPLFGAKEAIRRKEVPFTESEWKAAKLLTKAEVTAGEIISQIKLKRIQDQFGETIVTRTTTDIRFFETAKGIIKPPKEIKIKPLEVKAVITREGIIKPVGKIPSPTKFKVIGEPPIQITKLPKPKKLPTPLMQTFADPTLKVPKAFPTQTLKPTKIPAATLLAIAERIQKTKVKTSQAIRTRIATLSATIVGLRGRTFQLSKQRQPALVTSTVIQKERILTGIKPVQTFKVTQALTEVQKLRVGLIQEQLQRERQKLVQISRQVLVPTFKTPSKPVIPPPVTRLTTSQKKLVKALREISKKKQSVDVHVGMKIGKRRIIGKNLPPKLALRKAQRFVDKNIEASFKLKVNKKKPKRKDIKRVTISRKFRPSKRNVLFSVEKRKFRLDSPSERIQIQRAKRSTIKKLGIKIPKKKRRKKR